MKLHIIMLSGGLDSTGLLFKILEETKDEENMVVFGHHINLNNFYNLGDAEEIAVKHIVKYAMNNYNNFRFKSSSFEYKPQSYKTSETTIVYGFVMAIFTQDIIQHYIYNTGGSIPYVRVYQSVDSSEYNEGDWAHRFETQQKVFEAAFHEYTIKTNVPAPEIELPFIDLDRKEVYEYIPETLRDKIWSCRCPNKVGENYLPCGECGSCKENKRNGHI